MIALPTGGMAYIVATSFYQIATFSRHPGFSLFWIVLMGLTVVGVVSCTEFKLRIGNFSTNAQTTSPRSAAPALPGNPNE